MANGSPQVRRDDLKETDSAGFDWEEIDNPVTPTDREHLVAPPKPAVQVLLDIKADNHNVFSLNQQWA